MTANWRLHTKYIMIISELAAKATNKKEACDKYVVPLVNFAKSPSASLPVKKAVAECLANLVATVANSYARKLVHITMTKEILGSESSQQRLVWLLFLEYLLP